MVVRGVDISRVAAGADPAEEVQQSGRPGWSKTNVHRAMALVGLVQTLIVGWIVLSSGFQQDDYMFFYLGRQNGFSITGLTHSVFGSLIPGFMFVNTLLSMGSPIARWHMVVLILALYVVLIVVLYRLLELLFGPRPGIVLLTAIATCSGLLGVSLVWWTPAINSLPAIVADLLALDGLARHALTGKRRYLVLSVVSFAVGTAFYDPSMEVAVPLVLFTLLYLSDVRDWHSFWNAVRARAWLWLGYSVPILMNLAWRRAHPAEYALPPIASISRMAQFMIGGWTKGFVPSFVGANYLTISSAMRQWEIVVVGQVLFVGVVIFTIVRRRSAWRAWFLFLCSFAAADLVAAIGRASSPGYFQMNSLYWCFSGFLLMITLGLAFFPSRLIGGNVARSDDAHVEGQPRRARFELSHVGAVTITIALCAMGIHYIWTTPDRSLGAANRIYTDNLQSAWAKVAAHQPRSFVWDTSVPWYVLTTSFRPYNQVATTMALVVPNLRVDSPSGPGYLINSNGGLVRARSQVLSQVTTGPATGRASSGGNFCLVRRSTRSKPRLPLTKPVQAGNWFIRVHYTGSSGFNAFTKYQVLPIPRGSGTILIPLTVPKKISSLNLTVPKNASACLSVDIEEPVAVGAG